MQFHSFDEGARSWSETFLREKSDEERSRAGLQTDNGESQRRNTSLLTTPTVGQATSSAVGQQLGELGTEVTRNNLSIQPTIKIPAGYRFNVRVNKDILFEAPYTTHEL